jgi:hypothetical protein
MESSLEQMPVKPVSSVESLRVAAVQSLHSSREIGSGRLHNEMKVVWHQTVGVTGPPSPRDDLSEEGEKGAPIAVILEDDLPPIAARGDVVDPVRLGDSEAARHGFQRTLAAA